MRLSSRVGDVEEVAGTTGGIEHAVMVQPVAQFAEAFESFSRLDLLAPRFDDRGPDNLHDIDGAGEMLAEGAAFVARALLEEGAEDFGLDPGPIVLGDFAEGDDFGVGQLNGRGLRKQSAIKIANTLEAPAFDATGRVFMDVNRPPRRS